MFKKGIMTQSYERILIKISLNVDNEQRNTSGATKDMHLIWQIKAEQ